MRPAIQIPNRRCRYKLSIQYVGTKYSGWQRQPQTQQCKKFVQCAIELSKFHGKVCVASRTDAGVHAIHNVAHVDIYRYDNNYQLKESYCTETVRNALNHYMRKNKEDIIISNVESVNGNFHARYDAIQKEYVYRIVTNSKIISNIFERERRWFYHEELDVEALKQACAVFIGTHDFSSFATKNCENDKFRKFRRKLEFFGVETDKSGLDFWNSDLHSSAQAMSFTVNGKSFLTHQIRKMVGSAVCVASKKIKLEQLCEALDSKHPLNCSLVAPAHGLYLKRVNYKKVGQVS